MNRVARRERLGAVMAERGLAGFLVNQPSNVRYLTGYTGSNGIVCLGTEPRFLTDFRYATSVAALAVDWQVEIVQQSLLADVAARFGELFGAERVGFESSALSYAAWQGLDEAARAAGAELVPCEGVVEDLRAVKDEDEIALIRAGGEMCDQMYAWLAEEGLAGREEREVAWAIERHARELGAEGASFAPIVASGANGAQPHAVPGRLEIERSTLVVLDLGALVGGYCSDCTRTFATGPSEPQMMDVYETVLRAQEAALALVAPGQDCQEVHETARRVIDEARLRRVLQPRHGARRGDRHARGAALPQRHGRHARSGQCRHGRAGRVPSRALRRAHRGSRPRHRGRSRSADAVPQIPPVGVGHG